MAQFFKVKRFENDDSLVLPQRKTKESAGYDFMVAEDTLLIPYADQYLKMTNGIKDSKNKSLSLNQIADISKASQARPTLVPTGIKCKLDKGTYLELSVRSSSPLKHWLILANGVGIIDADYYNNPSNEGEIFFQIINLSPCPIQLNKGDIIGQGIIKHYDIIENEIAPEAQRVAGLGSTSQ